MNFLAHLFLSAHDQDLMIGNFIADFVKGNHLEQYPTGWQKGIKLHRQIDLFTDTHPDIERGRVALRPHFRKFSGVVMDVFGDHFLAKNWDDFYAIPLHRFTAQVYSVLQAHAHSFPERTKQMLPYMIKQNWLYNYQYIEGVKRALTGLSHRSKFNSGMETAHVELSRNYAFFEHLFAGFLPELIKFVEKGHEHHLRKIDMN